MDLNLYCFLNAAPLRRCWRQSTAFPWRFLAPLSVNPSFYFILADETLEGI